MTGLLQMISDGGFVMYPLLLCSLAIWAVIIERTMRYRKLGQRLNAFHLEAINSVLRGEADRLSSLCARYPNLPTSQLLSFALERKGAKDDRISKKWRDALERKRQLVNQDLRQGLWVLGTIGSASPFIGLFGTVVGILSSFKEIAKTGKGGFAIVAAGISEALIATAAGIVVAVIAVMAYNAFQTKWAALVLTVRIHTEELAEILSGQVGETEGSSGH